MKFLERMCNTGIVMKTLSLYNRKWVCWSLAIALLLMGTVSRASWQCLDGKPCDANCQMQHRIEGNMSVCTAPKSERCSYCHTTSMLTLAATQKGKSGCACTTPQCVMHVSDHPASSLQNGVKWVSPLWALLPPVTAFAPISIKSASISTSILSFYPQRFLRILSGRAPPIVL